MKTLIQLGTSLVALGALLGGTASAATSIAELPLKMSVLAKPNVIFGMDDSGSMDSELMLYNNDGAFWWNMTTANGWGVDALHPNAALRTITSTWFNPAGGADATWRKMVYLFPNGTGLGNRVYGDVTYDHFPIMPTRQFAFLRWSGAYKDTSGTYRNAPSDPALSPVHNPLYYNPLVTYEPWAPGYLSTGAVSPTNATPNNVKSHPIYGTNTFDLTNTRGASTTTDNFFIALPGMIVPSGSKKMVCNANNASCGAWTNVTADEYAALNAVTRVSMGYYPATYWLKETCTPENTSQVTDTCTTAPDGSTLKRYEIRSTVTSYPGGRNYADEMQNFANWFQYYRKRKMMLAGAMGQTMETLTGVRLGVVPFNSNSTVTLYDSDATSNAVNSARVAGIFYEANGSGGTPTRETLKYIGEQYKRTDKTGSLYNVIQYGCQRNNAFIVTDGFANASSVTMPAWDSGKSASNYGSTAPYANTYAGGLADLALRYYTNNPRPPGGTGLASGVLPATSVDTNTDLHMNTYGLTLGARGTLFLSETSPQPTSLTAWPDPSANRSPTSVDDLWHATINGRGKMYLATTPEETANRIRSGLDDILSQKATQGGISVNTVNLARGDSRAYLGSYNPAGWTGDLEAVTIDPVTGDLGTTRLWSASALLGARSWSSRVIATWGGSSGISFSSSVSSVASAVNPADTYGASVDVINYLRGNRTLEGTQFRTRKSLFGAVINSEPVVDRDTGVVYLASGEGMLHAVDTVGADAGKELWAYVPGHSLPEIGKTTSRGYTFRTELDGTPVLRKIDATTKLLVAGMGAGGRGYYAIDVTSPRGLSESGLAGKIKWEFPSASDTTLKAKVGQTMGKPNIVRTAAGTYAVIVTSGYNNTYDGKGRLWMLNAATGSVIKEFVTTDGSLTSEAGLNHVSPFAEADGSVRYVYGGDLLGNVWRFDLDADPSTPAATNKIAQLRGPGAVAQPVTTPPELLYYKGKRIVYVGTGRLLDIGDFGVNDVQSIYAIADGTLLTNARAGLVQQVYTTGGSGTLTSNPIDWATQRGWFMDLPSGEQVNTRPTIAFGGLAFVTNKAGSTDCSASSRMYIIDVLTGSKFIGADFVSTVVSDSSNASAVAAILTSDGKKVKGISREYNSGRPVPKDLTAGIPIPPSKNSWQELRR